MSCDIFDSLTISYGYFHLLFSGGLLEASEIDNYRFWSTVRRDGNMLGLFHCPFVILITVYWWEEESICHQRSVCVSASYYLCCICNYFRHRTDFVYILVCSTVVNFMSLIEPTRFDSKHTIVYCLECNDKSAHTINTHQPHLAHFMYPLSRSPFSLHFLKLLSKT